MPGVIEGRRQPICSTTSTLIHANDVHAGGHSFFSNAQHVVRFARAFQAMHENHSESALPVRLPMTVAQNGNARLNLDQSLLRLGERESSRDEKAGEGLNVSTGKETARSKLSVLFTDVERNSSHNKILLEVWLTETTAATDLRGFARINLKRHKTLPYVSLSCPSSKKE